MQPVGRSLGAIAGRAGVADLWCATVGAHAPALDRYCDELLSLDERARIVRYRNRAAVERYIVTRSLVRQVLGDRMRVAPRDVPVNRTDTGKPVVAGGVHFNVSHSGDLILLAVSNDRDVGVDVERRRDIVRVDALVERWLSPEERDDVARLARGGLTRSDAFLRIWSIKEARLKALGVGIGGQGRAGERLGAVEVTPLDAVLEPMQQDGIGGYVGALAFA